jgi:glutathione-regulated potassium-efflux system ancillary protein KefG
MARILLLFAHPALEKSRVHRRMLHHARQVQGVTINDLYEEYPDFDIDVPREQSLLLAHDVVILQHPIYWYSAPALVKQWEDLVLEHGWAYGTGGNALRGKYAFCAVTSGGRASAYEHGGYNRLTIREFLAPTEQTAILCGMRWVAPWVLHGTHLLAVDAIEEHARRWAATLAALRDDRIDLDAADPWSAATAVLPS